MKSLLLPSLCFILFGCGSSPDPTPPGGLPESVGMAGAKGTTPADLSKIRTYIRSDFWQGGGTGTMNHSSEVVLINDNPYPICEIELELSFSYESDKSLVQKKVFSMEDIFGAFELYRGGVLMPRGWSLSKKLDIQFDDMNFWRNDSVASVKILKAKRFEYGKDFYNHTNLLAFMHMCKPEELREAFRKDQGLKTVSTPFGAPPILMAMMQPDVEKVKILEAEGMSVTQTSKIGENALHYAVFGGPEMVRYVGSKGVKAIFSNQSFLPQYYALYQSDPNIFPALKDAGVNLETRDGDDDTILLKAAQLFMWDNVVALCKAGADMKATCTKDKYGLFAHLISGSSPENLEKAKKLVGGLSEKTADGSNLLMVAVFDQNRPAADWLIKQGLSPRTKNKAGEDAYTYLKKITHPTDHAAMKQILDAAKK
ncbi:MAG: ankyrin repeat domain-containing protein [Fimbriimonadaceae bacterium]